MLALPLQRHRPSSLFATMSTTSLPALLPPPAVLLPPPAAVTTVVVRLWDSSGERFGFVFLGFVIGVVFTVVVRWVHGLYLRAGVAAAPGAGAAAAHIAIGIPPPAPGAGEGAAAASAPPLYPRHY